MGRGRRGAGFRAEMEMEGDVGVVGEDGDGERAMTGILVEAEVDGLMSWVGEGARLREADWRVEAMVAAALSAILSGGCRPFRCKP